jgi:hypothetical protein
VPSVVGRSLADAEAVVVQAGLTPTVAHDTSQSCGVDLVSPAAGTPMPVGATVILTVGQSTGACPL